MKPKESWEHIDIGAHLRLLSGFPFASDRFSPEEGFPLIRIRDVIDSKIETYYRGPILRSYVIKRNDILIGMDGDFNVSRWKNQDALLNQRVLKVDVSDAGKIDLNFIYYWLQPFIRKINEATAATTVKHLSIKDIVKARDFLPPQKSQRKIARILQTIDHAIEQTEALIDKYQQIKAGLMHDLFTRGIGPDGQLRPPREQAPHLYQQTPIGWIPKEWDYKTLKDIFGPKNITNGPFGSDLLTSELKKEGVPVLYCQDVKPGFFERVSCSNVTQQKAAQLSFCNVRKGDILLAKVGTPPCDSCVYSEEEPAVVTQDVIRIRTGEKHSSGFFSNWFNTGIGRKSVKKISIEGTRERVSLGEFKELLLPVPEFNEQSEIESRIRALQDSLVSNKKELDKLQKQKYGLMHDLLTGTISVIADPKLAHD